MRSTILRRLAQTLAALLLTAAASAADAAPGDITLTLTAARFEWAAAEFSGYAFLCLQAEQGSGTSESCYSFYRNGGGKGFVGGPDVARTDLRRAPTRFPNPAGTISRKVSDSQRQAILGIVDAWNQREYEVTAISVMDLVLQIVKAGRFQMPPRKNESPEAFLRRLKAFNP